MRSFTLAEPVSYRLSGQVVALGGDATQTLLEPLLRPSVRVRGSSTYLGEPGVAAQLAYDGNPSTYWMSDTSDKAPSLHLEWGEKRTISSLRVVAASANASTPPAAIIRAGNRVRDVVMGTKGLGMFKPLRAKKLDILFPAAHEPDGTPIPIGVSELLIRGLEDLTTPVDPAAPTGAFCGLGPEVSIDGRDYPTRVNGTINDILSGQPLELSSCGPRVDLAAGTHEVRLRSTAQYAATAVTLSARTNRSAAAEPPVVRRPVTVKRWNTTDRLVKVASGAEAVLRVPENVNAGWRATLNGEVLEPVTVDGWQQGYVLPAGEGGSVHLLFTPDRPYRQALLAGLLAALALVAAAGWSRWRDLEVSFAAPSLLSKLPPQQASWPWPARLAAWVLGFVVAGPAVAIGLILGDLARPRRWVLQAAAGLVLASGAVSAFWLLDGPRQPPVGADILAALGVGLLASRVLTRRRPRGA